jgi:hypothetical protein
MDLLSRRFDHYFRHPDAQHQVLQPGDRAIACYNIRTVMGWFDHLQAPSPSRYADPSKLDEDVYDDDLRAAVRQFQQSLHHLPADGLVGPGTRQRIVAEVLHQYSASKFLRLRRPEFRQKPSVFISYAWADTAKVDKLDQWLRDHGVQVVRDREIFVAGSTIEESIAQAVATSDKILAILSHESRHRDWPQLERALAEQVESRLGERVLIYVRLEEMALPLHDSTRIAIDAFGHSLKDVGRHVLHAVSGVPLPPSGFSYDEDEPL